MLKSWILVLVAVFFGGSASAQTELLSNGNFDQDVAGWTSFVFGTSTVTFDAMDVDDSASSGSLRVEIDPAGQGNAIAACQCLDAIGGGVYDYSAWVFRGSSSPDGGTFLRLSWSQDRICNDGIGTGSTGDATEFDVWENLFRTAVVAPVGTLSANFCLITFEDPALLANRVVFWDAASVLPEPNGTTAALASLATLSALRSARSRAPTSP